MLTPGTFSNASSTHQKQPAAKMAMAVLPSAFGAGVDWANAVEMPSSSANGASHGSVRESLCMVQPLQACPDHCRIADYGPPSDADLRALGRCQLPRPPILEQRKNGCHGHEP